MYNITYNMLLHIMIIVNKLRKKYVKVLTISTYILLITYVTSVILYIHINLLICV